jgi:hypothetical protein
MVKYILILLIALGPIGNAIAHPYPITPRPLRLLVQESQFIISGYVVKVFENKKSKDHWDGTIARIAVMERLQGNIKPDTIEVALSPNMICPDPAHYEENTRVMAFIDKDKKGRYYTHALSYGAKTLALDAIEIYKARVLEMQQIKKIKDDNERYTQTVEWLVKCAENPITRWEGTYELNPGSDFMSYYDKGKKHQFREGLTGAHKDRLKQALFATTDVEYHIFGLVDIVYTGNECAVDAFLLKGLRALKEATWVAGEFMKRLAHLSNTPAMEKLMLRYDKIRFEYDKEAEVKKCVAEFIQLVEKAVPLTNDKSMAVSQ